MVKKVLRRGQRLDLLLVVDANLGIFRNSDISSWLENHAYKQPLDILKC